MAVVYNLNRKRNIGYLILFSVLFTQCSQKKPDRNAAAAVTTAAKQQVYLPPPYQTKSVTNYCKLIPWPQGKTPVAPKGFKVALFAGGLDNPRNIYVAGNGDIFVA
jgi:glucose/arabinose dehydrogenase